jgi:TPR repeat protein
MKKKCLVLVAALMMTLTAAHAGDFDKGVAAYNAGDYASAFVEFSELAEQGDMDAQYNLGLMYNKGEGVIQDYAAAVTWYSKSAEQGYAPAQFNLGHLYLNGSGVAQDYAAAAAWYTLAAEQGHVEA